MKKIAAVFEDDVETLIREARDGDEEALQALPLHPRMVEILDDVSRMIAWRYHRNRDDVRQDLIITLLTKIRSIRTPRCAVLKSFLYIAARNRALTELDREKRWLSINDALDAIPMNDTLEDQMVIHERIRAYLGLAEPGTVKRRIAELELRGYSPKEIAERTGESVGKVYRTLSQLHKKFIQKSGILEGGCTGIGARRN